VPDRTCLQAGATRKPGHRSADFLTRPGIISLPRPGKGHHRSSKSQFIACLTRTGWWFPWIGACSSA